MFASTALIPKIMLVTPGSINFIIFICEVSYNFLCLYKCMALELSPFSKRVRNAGRSTNVEALCSPAYFKLTSLGCQSF